MKEATVRHDPPLCPSAQPAMAASVVFGVVGGSGHDARVGYLVEPQPVTAELLALAGAVSPTRIFRFAAPCAGTRCRHFDGTRCRLAVKIVQWLPVVVEQLPPCRVRPHCRWWQQEGPAACLRCPSIVTETPQASEQLQQVADPTYEAAG